MTTKTVSLAEVDLDNVPLGTTGEVMQFRTKKEATAYAKQIGWCANDAMRVHGRLLGYYWVLVDPCMFAVARDPNKVSVFDGGNAPYCLRANCGKLATHIEHVAGEEHAYCDECTTGGAR